MGWVALVVRLVVGGIFTFGAVAVLFPQLGVPTPKPDNMPEEAATFLGLLMSSGYLKVIKVIELLGGLMVLSGRLAPLGITLVTPVAVNILLYEIFLLKQFGPGYFLAPLCGFLVFAYWRYFISVFTVMARAG